MMEKQIVMRGRLKGKSYFNKMYIEFFQSGHAILDKNSASGIHMGISCPASKNQKEVYVISLQMLVFLKCFQLKIIHVLTWHIWGWFALNSVMYRTSFSPHFSLKSGRLLSSTFREESVLV